MYVSIIGAAFVGLLALLSIWGTLGGDVIIQSIWTYGITMFAIWLISNTPNAYETYKKAGNMAINFGSAISIVSICIGTALTYLLIWNFLEDLTPLFKLLATIVVINFVVFVSIIAIDKWGSSDTETPSNQ